MSAWAEHLSALEAAVARTRAELRETDGDVRFAAPTTRPADSSVDDVDRARDVLDQLHGLIGELTEARNDVARELMLHRRLAAGRGGASSPAYVDQRG